VVGLDVMVGVLIGAMPRRREHLAERGRVGRRLVGDTSTDVILVVVMARSNKRPAALASRCGETTTSMIILAWPKW
jgi:hypothetical protein